MTEISTDMAREFAFAFAFLGNSLLAPMNRTEQVGLDPEFWAAFPDFGDGDVRDALGRCVEYAAEAQAALAAGGDPVRDASVEYTRLFVGPPKPAVPPWETFYRGEGATVGFGQATFEMRKLLRDAGLEISNENNQYADHAGIELLYLSVLCDRMADGDMHAEESAHAFASGRLATWIPGFASAVGDEMPGGYFSRLLRVVLRLIRLLD